MRRWRIVAVILLSCMLLAACATKSEVKDSVKLTGSALEGAQFFERVVENVTVHYALPTSPTLVEQVASAATSVVAQQIKWGRIDKSPPLHIWIVPEGYQWPSDLPMAEGVVAIAPGVIVAPEPFLFFPTGPGGSPSPTIILGGPVERLRRAMGVALTQAPESPAYSVQWIHDGIGTVVGDSPNLLPLGYYVKFFDRVPIKADEIWNLLLNPEDEAKYGPTRAPESILMALVMDRWGVNWWKHYPRKGDELTPLAMLKWATGANDEAEALLRWQERADFVVGSALSRVGGSFFRVEDMIYPGAADNSPIRVEPQLGSLPKGPGPNGNYSPHSYEIDVKYEPETYTIGGTEKLIWENGEGMAVDTLYFNLWPNAEQYAAYGGGMEIESVTVDGQPVEFKAQALDLAVPLGRPVEHGQKVEVGIKFTTSLPRHLTVRVFGQKGDRFHLAHWFPILAVLDDRGWQLQPLPSMVGEPYSETAQFRVTLDVPSGIMVGATGHQTAKRDRGDRWVYEYDAPNVRDWVATGGRDLHVIEKQVGNVTIRVMDGDEKFVKDHAELTAQAMEILLKRFGPYPYQDLVVTCCSGLEYPQFFFTQPIMPPREYGKIVTVHELAHQWFYSVVGNDQYGEPWMDEGFARYGERHSLRSLGLDNLLGDLTRGGVPAGMNISASSREYVRFDAPYGTGAYNKGALVLEDLEALMGSERFTQMLHEFVRRFQFKVATTADLMQIAEEFSGQDLTQFFTDHKVDPADRKPYTPLLPYGVMSYK